MKYNEKSTFSTIRQGTATNELTKTRQNIKANVAGAAIVTRGDLTATVENAKYVGYFKTSTYQLLDALIVTLTERCGDNSTIALPLEEYMEKRGIKDKKEARKQVESDLEILFNAKISFTGKQKKGKAQDFHDIRIIDSKGINKGVINVSFCSAFYSILMGYPVMPYPPQLWELNGKRNPNSFYLLRKIAEHKNMNVGKANEDIISVNTLLDCSPYFPEYKDVMKADRALNKRIIVPFERDMDALGNTLSWRYCHNNGEPLTAAELERMEYISFTGLLVKIDWKQYPDQSKRLERKEENKKKKQAYKKKKTDTEQSGNGGVTGSKRGGNGQQKGG